MTLFRTLLAVAVCGASVQQVWACPAGVGDLDGGGNTNVTDVQCLNLIALWQLAPSVASPPACWKVDFRLADIDCSGGYTVSDVLLLVTRALGNPLPFPIDANNNGCVDVCEVDKDGDGLGDYFDCAPLDAEVSPSRPEICNGHDDNCDGKIDGNAPTVEASCSDSDVCTGIEACSEAALPSSVVFNEVMVSPIQGASGQWVELYNPGPGTLNLSGWRLVASGLGEHVISPGKPRLVPGGGFFVIARSPDPAVNGGVYAHEVFATPALSPQSDTLALVSPGGAVVDQMAWGNTQGLVAVAGKSLSKRGVALPSADAESWAPGDDPWLPTPISGRGTPGGPNVDVDPPVSPCSDGAPLVCDDGDQSTQDQCLPSVGCVYTPIPKCVVGLTALPCLL